MPCVACAIMFIITVISSLILFGPLVDVMPIRWLSKTNIAEDERNRIQRAPTPCPMESDYARRGMRLARRTRVGFDI
ncbi:hypothetical protein GE061_010580 [Apolygus lucorum]|uniref:Uncharacterized protein n=1 Tax=Apolygus lucorum TaxID=248454 RepID=A0A6A4JJ01_APOLU|nr:hypothetical protein GE061_010580 [Apolygus lucorum]